MERDIEIFFGGVIGRQGKGSFGYLWAVRLSRRMHRAGFTDRISRVNKEVEKESGHFIAFRWGGARRAGGGAEQLKPRLRSFSRFW